MMLTRRSFSTTRKRTKKPPIPSELKSTASPLRRVMLEFTVRVSETFFSSQSYCELLWIQGLSIPPKVNSYYQYYFGELQW
nr:hypothetical protein Iba_chr01cCG5510 [Ipomoea batatas]